MLVFSGCGGILYTIWRRQRRPRDASQTSAVTLTVTDAPPAGVTVLSFEVTVNGAVLESRKCAAHHESAAH